MLPNEKSISTFVLDSPAFRYFKRLAFELGSSLGNNVIRKAIKNVMAAKMSQPNHQAPNQRGSSGLINGSAVGSIYQRRQSDAKEYPIAGPSMRRKVEKPEKQVIKIIIYNSYELGYDLLSIAGVLDLVVLSSM